jgi:hypothetical protein
MREKWEGNEEKKTEVKEEREYEKSGTRKKRVGR